MNAQEEEYAFYHEIGFALQQWSAVEWALETIVVRCAHDGPAGMSLAIGFLAVDNFRTRLLFVDALFKHRFGRNRELADRWKRIHKRLGELSLKRNQIAHRRPVRLEGAPSGERFGLEEG